MVFEIVMYNNYTPYTGILSIWSVITTGNHNEILFLIAIKRKSAHWKNIPRTPTRIACLTRVPTRISCNTKAPTRVSCHTSAPAHIDWHPNDPARPCACQKQLPTLPALPQNCRRCGLCAPRSVSRSAVSAPARGR